MSLLTAKFICYELTAKFVVHELTVMLIGHELTYSNVYRLWAYVQHSL